MKTQLARLLLFIGFWAHHTAFSQVVATPDTSPLPFHSYSGGTFDQIQLQNGSLSIRIPLFSIPEPGRNSLSFSIIAHSGSSIVMTWPNDQWGGTDNWYASPDDAVGTLAIGNANQGEQYQAVGPHVVHDEALSFSSRETAQIGYGYISYLGQYPIYMMHESFSLQEGLGISHTMGFDSTNYSLLRATDGSGWTLQLPTDGSLQGVFNWPVDGAVVASDATGHRFTFSGAGTQMRDLFGNVVIGDDNSISDTIHTSFASPLTLPNSDSSSCPSLGIADQTVGRSQDWSVPGPNGSFSTYKLCYTSIPLHTNFWGFGGDTYSFTNGVSDEASGGITYISETDWREQNQSLGMLQSVVLPDGSHWSFIYDTPAMGFTYTYGDIVEVDTPEGGTVKYTLAGIDTCGQGDIGPDALYHYSRVRAVTSRIASAGHGSPPVSTTYQYLPTKTIETTSGNDVVHSFTLDYPNDGNTCGAKETETQYYQGSSTDSNNTPIKDVQTSYSSVIAPQDIVLWQLPNPMVDVLPLQVTTQMTGQAASTLVYNYDDKLFTDVEPIQTLGSHNVYGLQTQQPVVSFHIPTSTDDGVRVHSTPSYAASHPSYTLANLLELRASSTVLDEQNQQWAKETFHYDEDNGSPQGIYGNLTSTSYWVGSGVSDLTDGRVYNAQGMLSQTIDKGGTITKVNTFQCGGLFPQSTTVAYGTSVAETSSQTRDCVTGQVTSETDANSVYSVFDRSDPLGRITKARLAIGTENERHTKYYYPSRTHIDVVTDQNAPDDGVLKSSVDYDGLGRLVRRTGPDGSEVATAYDANGNVQSVSNPYFSGSPVYMSFQYDALGRKTRHCNQDNGTGDSCTEGASYRQWRYTGDHVTLTDESGFQWTNTYDSLGRVVGIDEPLGAHTAYTYSVLDDLIDVQQPGMQGETARSRRTFNYDGLSRLIQSYNPEAGWTCYGLTGGTGADGTNCTESYDGNGNITNKTDARGVTIHYAYDALNRLTTKYPTDATSVKLYNCYRYDSSSSGAANFLGRVADQWTQMNVCNLSQTGGSTPILTRRSIVAYDANGNVLEEQRCVTSSCSTSTPVILQTSFDLAGKPLESTTGISGLSFLNMYDSAGRLAQVRSSLFDSNHPQTIYKVTSFYPGGLAQNYGIGMYSTVLRSYDDRLRPTALTANQR